MYAQRIQTLPKKQEIRNLESNLICFDCETMHCCCDFPGLVPNAIHSSTKCHFKMQQVHEHLYCLQKLFSVPPFFLSLSFTVVVSELSGMRRTTWKAR